MTSVLAPPSNSVASPPAAPALADCDRLVRLFDSLFLARENTRLVKGGEEPIYRPADATCAWHRIVFTRDYFSSALHEVAHWCVAGPARRLQEDYGYWYAPDGRTAAQQQAFEQVEVKPQALEWIFHRACGRRFRVSADNLEAGLGASVAFKAAIHAQVLTYLDAGLPSRARLFTEHLARAFDVTDPFCRDAYSVDHL